MIAPFGISIVIPVYNNVSIIENSVRLLVDFTMSHFMDFEIILVDDASIDGSYTALNRLAQNYTQIRLARHTINLGQQETIAHGISLTRFFIVATIDADIPCELHDLKKMAQHAYEGTELVLGRRKLTTKRKIMRSVGSKIASWFFRRLYSYNVQDFGCSTAVARRELIERFTATSQPIRLLKLQMLRLAKNFVEVEITVSQTAHGKSTYTLSRLLRLFLTILTGGRR